MYAVIFTATMKSTDEEYDALVVQLRELAFNEFGCIEFSSYTEGDKEVTISVWPNEEAILAWKQHPVHKRAQQRGREAWYRDYRVRVVNITREYSFKASDV